MDYQLNCLYGKQHSDQARQHANNSQSRTTSQTHLIVSPKASIAEVISSVTSHLRLPANAGSTQQLSVGLHAVVINNVSACGVIRSIYDYIVIVQQMSVGGCYEGMLLYLDIGVYIQKSFLQRCCLFDTDGACSMANLSVQISLIDFVRVEQSDSAYSCSSQIQCHWAPNAPSTYHCYFGIHYLGLAVVGNFFEQHLSGVPLDQGRGQGLFQICGEWTFFGYSRLMPFDFRLILDVELFDTFKGNIVFCQDLLQIGYISFLSHIKELLYQKQVLLIFANIFFQQVMGNQHSDAREVKVFNIVKNVPLLSQVYRLPRAAVYAGKGNVPQVLRSFQFKLSNLNPVKCYKNIKKGIASYKADITKGIWIGKRTLAYNPVGGTYQVGFDIMHWAVMINHVVYQCIGSDANGHSIYTISQYSQWSGQVFEWIVTSLQPILSNQQIKQVVDDEIAVKRPYSLGAIWNSEADNCQTFGVRLIAKVCKMNPDELLSKIEEYIEQ